MPISSFISLTPLRRKALNFFVRGKRDETTTCSFPLLRSEIAQRHPVLAPYAVSPEPCSAPPRARGIVFRWAQKVSIKKGVFAIQTFYAPNTASYPQHKFKTTWSKLTPDLFLQPERLHESTCPNKCTCHTDKNRYYKLYTGVYTWYLRGVNYFHPALISFDPFGSGYHSFHFVSKPTRSSKQSYDSVTSTKATTQVPESFFDYWSPTSYTSCVQVQTHPLLSNFHPSCNYCAHGVVSCETSCTHSSHGNTTERNTHQ